MQRPTKSHQKHLCINDLPIPPSDQVSELETPTKRATHTYEQGSDGFRRIKPPCGGINIAERRMLRATGAPDGILHAGRSAWRLIGPGSRSTRQRFKLPDSIF